MSFCSLFALGVGVFSFFDVNKVSADGDIIVPYNNLINSDFTRSTSELNNYWFSTFPISYFDDYIEVTATGRDGFLLRNAINLVEGHFYYLSFSYRSTVIFENRMLTLNTCQPSNDWSSFELYSNVLTYNNFDTYPYLSGLVGTYSLRYINLIDVSLLFGVGAEPSSLSSFKMSNFYSVLDDFDYLPFGSGYTDGSHFFSSYSDVYDLAYDEGFDVGYDEGYDEGAFDTFDDYVSSLSNVNGCTYLTSFIPWAYVSNSWVEGDKSYVPNDGVFVNTNAMWGQFFFTGNVYLTSVVLKGVYTITEGVSYPIALGSFKPTDNIPSDKFIRTYEYVTIDGISCTRFYVDGFVSVNAISVLGPNYFNFYPVLKMDNVEASVGLYENGYDTGYYNGYNSGYSYGYKVGTGEGTSQVRTINAIFDGIGDIALLPINMFLAIFNFEILGINISSFVSALLSVCIIILIFKAIIGLKV